MEDGAMQAGDRVFVAYAITHSADPATAVYGGRVLAVAERGDKMIQTDAGAVFTSGGPYSGSKLFDDEAAAWRWAAGELRRAAERFLSEAKAADEKASGVAIQTAGA
jgi:hypothetical protein